MEQLRSYMNFHYDFGEDGKVSNPMLALGNAYDQIVIYQHLLMKLILHFNYPHYTELPHQRLE